MSNFITWLTTPCGHVAIGIMLFILVLWILASTDPDRKFR